MNLYSDLLSNIRHDDPFENIAVRLIEDVANEVYNKAGSGVNLAAVLTVGLVRASRTLLAAGYHPREVHDWLQLIGEDFSLKLMIEATAVRHKTWEGNEEQILKAIATTAAKDAKVGTIIGGMCHKIGQFAHVDIVQDDIPEIRVEYRNGFTFKTNSMSYHFFKGKRKEFSNPKILFTDGKLEAIQPVVDIMVAANKAEAPLIIVANGIGTDVMTLLTHNHNIGALDIIALKAPSFNFGQFQALEDLAEITGGKPVSYAMHATPTVDHLGTASRVVVGPDYCTIYFTQPVSEAYINRVEKQTAKVRSSTLRLQVNERVSNLRGQAAVLRVGGYTDRERQAGYSRVETALHAVRGAQSEGYLPGGYQFFRRFPLLHARPNIPAPLYAGMAFPFTALMSNYKGDVPSTGRITDDPSTLFDVHTHKIATLLDSGVIDSAKAIRVAVESAISITKTLVLTGAIVTEA